MKIKLEIDPRGRHCYICNYFLPWEEFTKNIRGFNGKLSTCKVCEREKYLEKKSREAYEERYLTKK